MADSPFSPFEISNGRALVSLGPLSKRRSCTYGCGFCYVGPGFNQYPNWPNEDIVSYLNTRRKEFNIVYVSCDTDSFAPPRTKQGVDLLESLEQLGCDLLFTTRAVLDSANFTRLCELNQRMSVQGQKIFGCVSIPRLRSAPHLEPRPIPSPEARIEQLQHFKETGLVSVLAMRPFLPVIPTNEYIELVRLCQPFVDAVLGSTWYADTAGTLERRVLLGPTPDNIHFTEGQMDFNQNGIAWKIYEGQEARAEIERFCASQGIPFFMRSKPMLDHLRR